MTHALLQRSCPLRRPARRRLVHALAMAGMASCACAHAAAQAPVLPGGLDVVQGRANVAVQGGQMTVNNSSGAVLNWQSFSIGAGGGVHFQQPDAASRVLNRVVAPNPSRIFGSLTSNGEVWLVNPYGVLFGRDARVDVAGLVASTLNIANDDWRAGRARLTAGPGDAGAALVNQGELRTVNGGRLMLVAGSGGVRNDGLLAAPDGQAALAAGHAVELVDSALPHIAVRVQAPQGEALNLGRIAVGSGRVDLAAAMVNQRGLVQADAIADNGGRIELRASERTTLAEGSLTSATGKQGGEVHVLGAEVALLDGSTIDVSGMQGGGSVFAGGGVQGRDPAMPNARALYMGPQARIRADAQERGDGGRIVLWSDAATRAYGSLSARGGARGGDGGFIETSGGTLDARPSAVHTDAPAGAAGHWLLDPNDILISDQVDTNGVSAGPAFTSLDDNATVATATIAAALQGGNNVVVATGNGGANAQAGDITMQDASLVVQLGSPVSLTLIAARSVHILNSTISTGAVRPGGPQGSAALELTLSAANGPAGAGGVGEIDVQTSSISSGGGNITLGGAARAIGPNAASPRAGALGFDGGSGAGVSILGSTLDAGSGTLRISGQSLATRGDAYGVRIAGNRGGSSLLEAGVIDIFGWVDSNAAAGRAGVRVEALSSVVASYALTVEGRANSGVYQANAPFGPAGVAIEGALAVNPPAPNPNASLVLRGSVADAQAAGVPATLPLRGGVVVEGARAAIGAFGGSTVDITGTDDSPNGYPAVRLAAVTTNFTDAADVSIAGNHLVQLSGVVFAPSAHRFMVQSGTTIDFGGANIQGQPSLVSFDAGSSLLASSALVSLGGAGGALTLRAPSMDLASQAPFVSVSTSGPIQLFTDVLTTRGNATFESSAAGTAVLAAGYDRASNVAQLMYSGVPLAFNATAPAGAGRWLLYAHDDAQPVLGMPYTFLQYGSIYPAPAQGAGNGIVFAQNATLTLQSALTPSKVYDGLADAPALPAAAFSVTGLRPGQQFGAALPAPALIYSQTDAGVGIPMSAGPVAVPPVHDANGRPVYGYTLQSDIRGNITPRPLNLAGVAAADKVYDGTRSAVVGGGVLGGLVGGETLGFSYANALFDNADVGAAKAVSADVTLRDGTGRAANYALPAGSVSAQASITPATLTYVAEASTARQGQLPASFSGSVSGFVPGDTLDSATQGSLSFVSLAPAHAAPGTYAIEGQGLAARNYVFAQAPGNATALTLLPALGPGALPGLGLGVGPGEVAQVLQAASAERRTPLDAPAAADAGTAFDVTPALHPAAGGGVAFAALDLDMLPPASLDSLLQAREMYMRRVLRAGMAQLDADPTLADLAACATVEQAESGSCLVTEELVATEQGVGAAPTAAAPPVPRPAAAAKPAPAAPPPAAQSPPSSAPQVAAAAPATAPAPVPAAPPAPGAAPVTGSTPGPAPAGAPAVAAAAPAPTKLRPAARPVLQPPTLPPPQPVSSAALPQIRRKLALLFGNDNFADASIPTLDNAGRDVDAVGQVLERHLGYETIVVHDAGRQAMVGALNRLALTARPSDSVIVYYAGHGTVSEANGHGYWIPADADAARPKTWLANADIERLMGRIRASQVVLVADSCFSGTLVGTTRGRPAPATLDLDALLRRRAEVVMSSGGNEPVADGGRDGHSPFAASLMQSLQSLESWRPGASIYQRVREDVTRRIPQTPQYGPLGRGHSAEGADYLFEQRTLAGARR